ncbi:MAG: ubiquinone biosynthesis protein UbiH [Comamonadaceae bacterium]|nr:MAG: ubiquinone biosynthesis protein UbiH [Comamonadaceae bacterium]
MALPPDVCIRGAGIVGRTLALLLARERLRVALVVPAPAAETTAGPAPLDVRAYALNAASRELLESLRAWPDAPHATPVLEMQVHGDAGGELGFQATRQDVEALAWIVDVPALERRLADATRFQPLIEEVAAPVMAALTVVCEGKASSTRDMLGVSYELTPYPQQAIAARLSSTLPHGATARQWFGSAGEVLALLPTGGIDGHSLALVWSVDQFRAPALMALPPAEFCTALHEATGGALGELTLESDRAAWPLQRAIADRWTGRLPDGKAWALAGDAAHVVHPLAGQGLNLGLADASALHTVLKEREYWRGVGDARLLRRYERERRADVLSMSLATDGLQQLFSQSAPPLQALRNWGLRGFDRSTLLKQWVARHAMGLR